MEELSELARCAITPLEQCLMVSWDLELISVLIAGASSHFLRRRRIRLDYQTRMVQEVDCKHIAH